LPQRSLREGLFDFFFTRRRRGAEIMLLCVLCASVKNSVKGLAGRGAAAVPSFWGRSLTEARWGNNLPGLCRLREKFRKLQSRLRRFGRHLRKLRRPRQKFGRHRRKLRRPRPRFGRPLRKLRRPPPGFGRRQRKFGRPLRKFCRRLPKFRGRSPPDYRSLPRIYRVIKP
jgi:hypothetical protein